MSKSLTLSMSLALALGFSGVSFAGHKGTAACDTCGLASPQGTVASPQASPQGVAETCDTCAPKKKHCFKMPECFKHKPKMYTYEWVLKKKKVHGHHAAEAACDTCGTGVVTPSGQYSSPQGTYAAPQATYGAPQAMATYGAPQATLMPTTEMKPAPAPAGDAVPPAPVAPPAPPAPAPPAPSASNSLLFLSPAGN